jgi:ankyrin repeat protein
MKILKITATFVLLLSLLACSTIPRGFEFTPDKVLMHQASGTAFPEQIASFTRNIPVSYNSEATDISVNYRSKQALPGNLDVYVFPAIDWKGPIGLTNQHSDFVRTIMKKHPDAVVESDADTQVTQAGELQAATQATFTYSDVFGGVRQKLFSILLEFEHMGWFISYRMDTPIEGKEEAIGLLLDFMRMAPLPSKAYTPKTTGFFGLVWTETPENVRAAISNGADVNQRDKDGATPLMYAARNSQNPEVITALLDAGADVNARDPKYGTTPLMFAAAANKNPEMISMLLEAGADLKARSEGGLTVLMWAAGRNPNPEVITTLLKAGAELEARNKFGATALMYAAADNQNPEVISSLLEAGSDAKAKDNTGKAAFDYAQNNPRLKGTDAYRQLQKASQ